jgi:cyanophycinase
MLNGLRGLLRVVQPTSRAEGLVKRLILIVLVIGGAVIAPLSTQAQVHGPSRGTLVISGGDETTLHIAERFIALAGGPDAPIVVVPTSGPEDVYDESCSCLDWFRAAGAKNLKILHTRDRRIADTDAFVEPLRQARGVWFWSGNAWRHQDAYLDTRVHREVFALLDRGGVVGGGSAGARIQSDYMPTRGLEPAQRALPREDWRRGFQLVRNVIIDVHVLARNRQFDMIGMIEAHPAMLGIGVDENTAIVVQGDSLEVIGTSYAIIYDNQRQVLPEGEEVGRTVGGLFYFLRPGDTYDMKARQAFRPSNGQPFDRVGLRPWKIP